MIVVDASAIVAVLAGQPTVPGLAVRLTLADGLHAPHLVDLEVAHALGRLARRAIITEGRARDAVLDMAELNITRYPHDVFLERIWDLRHGVTAYGAAYIALAEALEAPLVTCDARLTRSTGHSARVELLGAG